jgi:hypothetical protein
MKKLICLLSCIFIVGACNDKKSLQEYFVEKENSAQFISASLPTGTLFQNLDSLSAEQNNSLKKIEKINLLALSKNKDSVLLQKERRDLKLILNQPDYEPLISFSSGNREAKLLYVGTENEIDELIFFGFDSELGLLLLRMRGNDVNASDIYQISQSAQSLNINALPQDFGNIFENLEK